MELFHLLHVQRSYRMYATETERYNQINHRARGLFEEGANVAQPQFNTEIRLAAVPSLSIHINVDDMHDSIERQTEIHGRYAPAEAFI